jgi:hypothetical protein
MVYHNCHLQCKENIRKWLKHATVTVQITIMYLQRDLHDTVVVVFFKKYLLEYFIIIKCSTFLLYRVFI